MRVIKQETLREYAELHPKAESPLQHWETVTLAARWRCFQDVRDTFRNADQVTVESGRTVVIFNIRGNNFQLITAIHYPRNADAKGPSRVFILDFLTHAEYSKDQWKQTL